MPVGNDIYTAHINRGFAKKLKINMGIGAAVTLFGAATLTPDTGVWSIVCLIVGIAVFLVAALILFGARHPLRLTDGGVVARYGLMRELVVPWRDVLGIAMHPRRKRSCLVCRTGASPEPRLLAIPWTMIEESEREVAAAVKRQLVLRGVPVEEDGAEEEDAARQAAIGNPLKDFWS